MFKKAVKYGAKLRLALAGAAGYGKTYSALTIATGLASGGEIALIDTEHGSASKYADDFDFFTMELGPPHHPERYVEALKNAEQKYSVVIIDSLSYAWQGDGGLLQIVDQIAKRTRNPNTFAAWREATPIQDHLIETILGLKAHVIVTMRSKMAYIIQEDGNGKKVPVRVGMEPIQRDGMEYFFDIFGDMREDHSLAVVKTRCPAIADQTFLKPGKEFADILLTWLNGVEKDQREDEQAKARSLALLINELREKALCAYGDDVNTKLAGLALFVSNGASNNIEDLNIDQINRLLAGVSEKLSKLKTVTQIAPAELD